MSRQATCFRYASLRALPRHALDDARDSARVIPAPRDRQTNRTPSLLRKYSGRSVCLHVSRVDSSGSIFSTSATSSVPTNPSSIPGTPHSVRRPGDVLRVETDSEASLGENKPSARAGDLRKHAAAAGVYDRSPLRECDFSALVVALKLLLRRPFRHRQKRALTSSLHHHIPRRGAVCDAVSARR